MGNTKETYSVEEYKNKILEIEDLERQKKAIHEKIEACNMYIKGFESYHKSMVNSNENKPTSHKQLVFPVPTNKKPKSRMAKVSELLEKADRPLALKDIINYIMDKDGQDVNNEELFRTLEKSFSGMMKMEVDKNGRVKRKKNESNKWTYYLAPEEM